MQFRIKTTLCLIAAIWLPQTVFAESLPSGGHVNGVAHFDRLAVDPPDFAIIAAGTSDGPIAFSDATDRAGQPWHWEFEFGTPVDSFLAPNSGVAFVTPNGAWVVAVPPGLPPDFQTPVFEFIFDEGAETGDWEFNVNSNIGSNVGYDTSIVEFDAPAPDPGWHLDEYDYTTLDSLIADYPDFDGVITSFPANKVSMELIHLTHPLPDNARILPEPSSVCLLLLGGFALLGQRRKKRNV